MIPGTRGRFNLDHERWRAGPERLVLFRRRRELQPRASTMAYRREGKFLARRAQLTRATPYAVTGCNEYEPARRTRRTCGDRAEKRGGGEVLRTASQQPLAPRAPGRRLTARRLLTAAAAVLAVALLFLAYLRVSRTYPENSDESNDLLMAWDMLHGNVLLHGWYLSDVSFITTELPQYALLVALFGLHTDTAHIAAAMTYTLV